MDYAFDHEETHLRARVRSLISDFFPDGFPGIFVEDEEPVPQSRRFCEHLAHDALLTLAWPREYGGKEASPWAQTVVREEMWAHNEPRGPQYMNLNWIGPAVMRFGTEEQKRDHLPRIAAGEVIWSQGFSEPDAGSDLASLRLRADEMEGDGDGDFVLTGQKIWTSYADIAQWCVVAARTDPSGPKHHGITVFLLPLDREGIEVRPIDSMLGPHHFNEVFFDGVRARRSEILGELHRGWEVITAALHFERAGIARYARSAKILSDVSRAVAEMGDAGRSDRARFARAVVHTRVTQLLNYRVVADSASGRSTDLTGPLIRIANTTLEQEVAHLALDALGEVGLLDHHDARAVAGGHLEHHWRYSLAATVAAGTLEIQKLLASRHLLR